MRTLLTPCALVLAASSFLQATPWKLPVTVQKLPNGLTVVVSENHEAPTVGVSVAYHVGFRLEPKNRTGFAHLFEHFMFEGTPQAPKGTLGRVVEGSGGDLNGSTRWDYTDFTSTAPVSALERILWLEADRMKTLDFTPKHLQNQQEVVKEEIRVNVTNQPYGAFFWLDLPHLAFDAWENNHDGYGSFQDLDHASLDDVAAFHRSYYGPNNAVLSISGDVKPEEVMALVRRHFGSLESRPVPPTPKAPEALHRGSRSRVQEDPLARIPAFALGWQAPPCGTPDHAAFVVLKELLIGGDASRLTQALVKEKQLALGLQGGVNWPLSTQWVYEGPTLFTVVAYQKPGTSGQALVDEIQARIQAVADGGVPEAELRRTKTQLLADFHETLELPLLRAAHLGLAQLLLGDAEALNRVPARLEAVTSADLQRVARTYLSLDNRAVLERRPAAPQK